MGSGATGDLTVFAAASLTEPFTDLQAAQKVSNPSLSITYSFAGSGALGAQIENGAPADVIATADEVSMQRLVDAGLVEVPTVFATNQLAILVAPGNPLDVGGLTDLEREDIKLVLGDSTVPVGRYADQVLSAAGVTVAPVSRELDVKAAVAKVTSGEADAAIVYATDVTAAGARGEGVVIPEAQNVVARYPVAVVRGSPHRSAASAFIELLIRGAGRDALEAPGFLPPR